MKEPLEILVEALGRLQDVTGGEGAFSFPKIITVGNQSAGKSSIIEAIVGKPFLPRGADIVTRCPLRVRLHQTDPKTDEYAIFDYKNGQETEKRFTDFNEVSNEIDRRTEQKTSKTKNISKEEIHLDIFSPKYPDLQFVDLPGFTKCPVKNQDEDIEQQIQDLNIPYMEEENTIILAIQDATQDIGVSEALKHALSKKIDPEGNRTIGVLTKLDNLHSITDKKRVVDILENRTKPLKLGYIGVVNRSQEDIDKDVDIETSRMNQDKVLDQQEFIRVRDKIGIDVLRRQITRILAEKVKEILPELQQKREDELKYVLEQLKIHGFSSDGENDIEDLISQLVEKSISKIRINLEGFDTRVTTETHNTGANLNRIIKEGAIESSKKARQTQSVTEFHEMLKKNIEKTHGIRDNMLPVELVMEVGVSILTENYRNPFKDLLNRSTDYLKKDLIALLDFTLKPYPNFKDLVQKILLRDLEENKTKAEEYLDVQINSHKRFINCEHTEFSKLNQELKEDGIRFKNPFHLWFKESIPHADQNQKHFKDDKKYFDSNEEDNGLENIVSKGAEFAGQMAGPQAEFAIKVSAQAIKAVRGYVARLQNNEVTNVHTNKLPSKPEDEALLHLDLCIDYMEIIDKALVDVVPKIFIMMLVMKTIDFLNGVDENGNCYKSSLLREVNKEIRDKEKREHLVTRSHSHEMMVRELHERKKVCEETISIIEATNAQLNECT